MFSASRAWKRQVDQVLDAQLQATQHQRVVDDRRHEDVLWKLCDFLARLDAIETKVCGRGEFSSDEDESELFDRMDAFEKNACASEEAMEYSRVNKRLREVQRVGREIDDGMSEFVDHFNARADELERRLSISEGASDKTAETEKSSAQQQRQRHEHLEELDFSVLDGPTQISDTPEAPQICAYEALPCPWVVLELHSYPY